jgi:hypothetical protein
MRLLDILIYYVSDLLIPLSLSAQAAQALIEVDIFQ